MCAVLPHVRRSARLASLPCTAMCQRPILTQFLSTGTVDRMHQVTAAVLGTEVVEYHAVRTQMLSDLEVVALVVAIALKKIDRW